MSNDLIALINPELNFIRGAQIASCYCAVSWILCPVIEQSRGYNVPVIVQSSRYYACICNTLCAQQIKLFSQCWTLEKDNNNFLNQKRRKIIFNEGLNNMSSSVFEYRKYGHWGAYGTSMSQNNGVWRTQMWVSTE